MNRPEPDGALEALPVLVHLGDSGPYPGKMVRVFDERELALDVTDAVRMPLRVGWRVDVTGVPYRDAYAVGRFVGDGLKPVEPVFTTSGDPERYTARAWLTNLDYHVGPPNAGGNPFDREEWLTFTLEGIGSVRDLRPVI